MNILNILYTFHPGGVERLAIDVSNELASEGHNAHICVISEKYSTELLAQLDNKVELHLLEKQKKNSKIGYVKQILQIIDRKKIEIVHVHQGTLMNFFFLIKMLRPRVNFFFTVHDTYIFSNLSRMNQRLSVLICKKLIAISDAVLEDISQNGVQRKRIERVYNGVNFCKFSESAVQEKKEFYRIVNVARFFPEKKGQDILVKASAILKRKGIPIRVCFAGGELSESTHYISDMKQYAAELDVADSIVFLGNVTDVPSLLRTADVFCIPSRYEGFGIAAVEAMGMGLPCVASNIAGLNEVVDDEALGLLFELDNAEDLAVKLEYVITHKTEFNAEKIAANVRSRFSIETMTHQLVGIYRG